MSEQPERSSEIVEVPLVLAQEILKILGGEQSSFEIESIERALEAAIADAGAP